MTCEQEVDEIRTFRRFAEVCPVAIALGSITTQKSPQPDIACELSATREEVAFELVEIVDNEFARLESNQSRENKCSAAVGYQTNLDKCLIKPRAFAGNDNVARERKVAATTRRCSVNRCYERQRNAAD